MPQVCRATETVARADVPVFAAGAAPSGWGEPLDSLVARPQSAFEAEPLHAETHDDSRSAQVPPRTPPLPPSGRRCPPLLRQGGGRHPARTPRPHGPARAPQSLAAAGTP